MLTVVLCNISYKRRFHENRNYPFHDNPIPTLCLACRENNFENSPLVQGLSSIFLDWEPCLL
jgi:hypothetical protein